MFTCIRGPAHLQGIICIPSSSFMLLSQSAAETRSGIHISEDAGLSIIGFSGRTLLTAPLRAILEQKRPGLITDLLLAAGKRLSHLPVKSCRFEAPILTRNVFFHFFKGPENDLPIRQRKPPPSLKYLHLKLPFVVKNKEKTPIAAQSLYALKPF